MKIIVKIPLALGCLIVFFGAGMVALDRFFILPSFERLEMRSARRNLDRVLAAVSREGQHLATLDRDWSAWDDTYSFAAGGSPGYVAENLNAGSWKPTGVDLMAIYGRDGRLLFQGSYDRETGTVVPETLFPRSALPGSPYLHTGAAPEDIVGMVDSPRGVYVLASTPILRTNGSGPARGSFLMGRLIDSAFAAELHGQTSVNADLFPAREAGSIDMASVLAQGGKTLKINGRREILGYGVLRDLWGSAVLVVRTHTAMDITAWSRDTMRISLFIMLALALLSVVVQYLLLLRFVVKPLGSLQEQVLLSHGDTNAAAALSVDTGRDEIGSLASAFTELEKSLAARRRELQTANENLEAKVEERTRDLRKAGEDLHLLAKVVESTGDSVVITDLSANILRVNEAFCRTSGYAETELLGKNPRIMKSDRHEAAYYRDFWQRLTTAGTWQGEIWDRRKSGEVFPRWLTVNLVRDERGQPSCYVGVSSDISNIKAAEERLNQLAYFDPLTGLPNRSLFQTGWSARS